MKTIDAGTVSNVAELLSLARSEAVLLTTSDGHDFILTEVGEISEAQFDAEIEAIGKNRELMALLEERSRETKRVSLSEAKRRLGLD